MQETRLTYIRRADEAWGPHAYKVFLGTLHVATAYCQGDSWNVVARDPDHVPFRVAHRGTKEEAIIRLFNLEG